MDNPEKRATWGTQDEGAIKNGQSRETGNMGYTRRRGNQKQIIQDEEKQNKNTTMRKQTQIPLS